MQEWIPAGAPVDSSLLHHVHFLVGSSLPYQQSESARTRERRAALAVFEKLLRTWKFIQVGCGK